MADQDVEKKVAEKPVSKARSGTTASLAENLSGGGAIVLAIIGLAGVYSGFVASIAVLVIGAALLFEGVSSVSRLRRLMEVKSTAGIDAADLGGGMSTEFFGGVAGLTLGILSIVGVVSVSLIAIAVLVFGAAILKKSRATARVNCRMIEELDESQEAKDVAHELVMSASSVQMFIGLSAVTLGIIAVIGTEPLVLTLVALLAIGFGNLFGGKAFNDRVLGVFH